MLRRIAYSPYWIILKELKESSKGKKNKYMHFTYSLAQQPKMIPT